MILELVLSVILTGLIYSSWDFPPRSLRTYSTYNQHKHSMLSSPFLRQRCVRTCSCLDWGRVIRSDHIRVLDAHCHTLYVRVSLLLYNPCLHYYTSIHRRELDCNRHRREPGEQLQLFELKPLVSKRCSWWLGQLVGRLYWQRRLKFSRLTTQQFRHITLRSQPTQSARAQ